jgi:hypothetical protein
MTTKRTNLNSNKSSIRLWSEVSWLVGLGIVIPWLSLWYTQLAKPLASAWQLAFLWAALLFGGFWITRKLEFLQSQPFLQRFLALGWMISCAVLPGYFFIWQPLMQAIPSQPLQTWLFSSPAVFNQTLSHLVICLLISWHVLDLGQRVFSREIIQKEFEFGCLAFLLYGLVYYPSQPAVILRNFAIFLFLGLLVLCTARIAEQEAVRGGRLPKFYSLWLPILLAVATLTALFSFLIPILVGVPLASILAQAVLLVLSGLALLIILVLSPVLALILEAAFRFGQKIFTDVPNLIPQSAAQEAADNMLETSQQALDLFQTQNGRPVLLIAIILAVLVLATLSLRFRYYRRNLRPEEQSDQISAAGRKKTGLDAALTGIPRPGWISARKALAAARVRIVYAQLMDLSQKLGQPRPPALTPAEFLPTLNSLWPEHSQELDLITHAYQKVRYGQLPETKSEVEDVLMAWKEIQKSGFIKKAQNK